MEFVRPLPRLVVTVCVWVFGASYESFFCSRAFLIGRTVAKSEALSAVPNEALGETRADEPGPFGSQEMPFDDSGLGGTKEIPAVFPASSSFQRWRRAQAPRRTVVTRSGRNGRLADSTSSSNS